MGVGNVGYFSKTFFGGEGEKRQQSDVFDFRKGKVLNTDLSDFTDFTMRSTYTPLDMHAPKIVYISSN